MRIVMYLIDLELITENIPFIHLNSSYRRDFVVNALTFTSRLDGEMFYFSDHGLFSDELSVHPVAP